MLLLSLGLFSWGSVNKDRFTEWVGLSKLFFQTCQCSPWICGKAAAPISQAQHKLQASEFCVASTARIYHGSDLVK